ncbi:hypothetical protein CPC08DRAFT_708531 [Agrocybe pediades]|nr:hypothetical protein CPC08DRAFT_708531 [Agrocybe pediades]
MMANRRVPAALHQELSEYASLLRALRVRDAMDVTKHLVKGSPFAMQLDAAGLPMAGPSDLNHPYNSPHKTEKARGKERAQSPVIPGQHRRDHWTRWPLPLNDVLVPEWTLQDEINVISSHIARQRPPLQFPVPIASAEQQLHAAEGDDDDDDRPVQSLDMDPDSDDPDAPYYVPYLSSIVANYLSVILGILASHTPARPASMQNRIEPLNWRSVLDVVVSCGITEYSNPKVVENVIKRMEAIYGPSILPIEGERATSFRSVERMKNKQESSKAFEVKFDQEVAKYFDPITLHVSRSPSPQPLLPQLTLRNKTARQDAASYKARKKRTPYAKPPTSKASSRRSTAVEASPPPDNPAHIRAEDDPNEQELPSSNRRSKRARRGSVNYRDILPEEIIISD